MGYGYGYGAQGKCRFRCRTEGHAEGLFEAYGGVLLVVLLSLGLYLIFAAPKGYFDIGAFLETTSPYSWALTGIGLNIGMSTIGAGWSVTLSA